MDRTNIKPMENTTKYRILNDDEIIKKGDEFKSAHYHKALWTKADNSIGKKAGDYKAVFIYRRRLHVRTSNVVLKQYEVQSSESGGWGWEMEDVVSSLKKAKLLKKVFKNMFPNLKFQIVKLLTTKEVVE